MQIAAVGIEVEALMIHKWKNILLALVLGMSLTFLFYSIPYAEKNRSHADLVRLFKEFREFVEPTVTDGIPDYTETAMKRQWDLLKNFQDRLETMDISEWPVSQQVDFHIVRAEMNGLDFHHRVLQPWVHNPGFYGTELIPGFPARGDGINVFLIDFPLLDDEAQKLK